jgi:predicted S18 family serine protease
LYRQTATALQRIYALYSTDDLSVADNAKKLVMQAEQTMEFENGAWRAGYLNDQRQKEIEGSYNAAIEAARAAAAPVPAQAP